MISYCPRCGAAFQVEPMGEWLRANIRCPDCRLAITEVPAMLAPSENEVGYELVDWPVSDRGAVTAALAEIDIPFRWEEGLELVVPAEVEPRVDRLLDEIQSEFAGQAPDADLDAEGDEADGGEEAQAAMADLFVAADRLQHAPYDKAIGDDMVAAAAAVAASLAPFGMEGPLWDRVQTLASDAAAAVEEESDGDLIVTRAREVRDFLRDYV
ncbi:MAG: zinc-ribbon domain-containing protein [Actinomycetota bacterium]|nr:zinc-ribbon domain-containing protein [Actinomycetota bacterium]